MNNFISYIIYFILLNYKVYCNNINCAIVYDVIECHGDFSQPQILEKNFLSNRNFSLNDRKDIRFTNVNLYNIDMDWTDGLNESEIWEYVHFNYNRLNKLDVGVFDSLKKLKLLTLGNNNLTLLPVGLFDQNINLKYLLIDSNNISSLDIGLFDKLYQLEYLNISDNKLIALPMGIFTAKNYLTNLYLNINNISILESGIFHTLPQISYMSLSNNPLTIINSNIFNNLSLVRLDLSYCKLSDIDSDAFSGLKKLNEFHLNGNNLRNIPETAFRDMKNLKYLNLSENYLLEIPNNLFDGLDLLETVYLNYNNLSEVPIIPIESQNKLKLFIDHNNINDIQTVD